MRQNLQGKCKRMLKGHEDSMSGGKAEPELKSSQIISADDLLCGRFQLLSDSNTISEEQRRNIPKLTIPDYQRPYKWGKRNICDLLEDIETAIKDHKKPDGAFHYRIGTIILHDNKHEDDNKDKRTLDLVDGQQRCISLLLLKLCLEPDFEKCSLLHKQFTDPVSQQNIHDNYKSIENWFAAKGAGTDEARKSFIDGFIDAFSTILQVVVLVVPRLPEAFQLFDSQNSRGKELDPQDLLKAYHLREMRYEPFEMQPVVARWEKTKPDDIRKLFNDYLFPILNWARKESASPFTAREIGAYKGVSRSLVLSYPFAERTLKAMPIFQITEDFMAGKDFFDMVHYYLLLLEYVKTEARKIMQEPGMLTQDEYKKFDNSSGTGIRNAWRLFECAAFCYYDRFQNFDPQVLTKLFTWAFMIRVDMTRLSFDTINRYAQGIKGGYSNALPMFAEIVRAKKPAEISAIELTVKRDPYKAKDDKWNGLYEALKRLNGNAGGES